MPRLIEVHVILCGHTIGRARTARNVVNSAAAAQAAAGSPTLQTLQTPTPRQDLNNQTPTTTFKHPSTLGTPAAAALVALVALMSTDQCHQYYYYCQPRCIVFGDSDTYFLSGGAGS